MTSLAIMLLTYGGHPARREYAFTTLQSTLERIRFDGTLYVHIADDGSPIDHRQSLRDFAGGFPGIEAITISNSDHRGYGANYNEATQVVHSYADVVLALEDDWRLEMDLDLNPLVGALVNDPLIGCIRLGYLGTTQPLFGEVMHSNGRTYLLLDPDSPEPHVFAGGPRIESVAFERQLGTWPDEPGLLPGEVEFRVANRRSSRIGIAWPLDLPNHHIFAHIGAVRSTEES